MPNDIDIERVKQISEEIIDYSRNQLIVSLRFLDLALCKLRYEIADIETISTDSKKLYYNPSYIFNLYKNENNRINHSYLHIILHCIFYHPFANKKVIEPLLWNLASDIAVESVIDELNIVQTSISSDVLIKKELLVFRNKVKKMTAENIYKQLLLSPLSQEELKRIIKLFTFDDHSFWYKEEDNQSDNMSNNENNNDNNDQNDDSENESQNSKSNSNQNNNNKNDRNQQDSEIELNNENNTFQDWKEISEKVKVDLKTINKKWGNQSSSFVDNIEQVNKEKYDFSEFIKKFAILNEAMVVNDDEFDYIFYTYGLSLYKNMPLIEPLEYKEEKRIKDFVIAIDTSGSVSGDIVKKFVNYTFSILTSQDSFFTKTNIHIVQCDAKIQKDDKITSKEDVVKWCENMKLYGFGGTDFTPVFEYVDELIRKKEFSDLRGLIYFTDGEGTFPKKIPKYKTAFVLLEEDRNVKVPPWAIKLVITNDEIKENFK